MPHAPDLPPWHTVHQQTQRWIKAGVFDDLVHDLRCLLRVGAGREEDPTAAILDSRTLRSTVESGHRAGYDGAKRKRGSKVHLAVDTLGHLLALHVSPVDEQDRQHVGELAEAVQAASGASVEGGGVRGPGLHHGVAAELREVDVRMGCRRGGVAAPCGAGSLNTLGRRRAWPSGRSRNGRRAPPN